MAFGSFPLYDLQKLNQVWHVYCHYIPNIRKYRNLLRSTQLLAIAPPQILAVGHETLAAGAHCARFIHELGELAPDFALPADFASVRRLGSLEVGP